MNKKSFVVAMITLWSITVIFMIIGLASLGAAKVGMNMGKLGSDYKVEYNGFKVLSGGKVTVNVAGEDIDVPLPSMSVSDVMSSQFVEDFKAMDTLTSSNYQSGARAIQAGVVFAVVLTPILAAASIATTIAFAAKMKK